ncbi:MAG: ABC transporter substrate-binding protein [Betaproteobacteria bacterium]|nr:ABC transporter substrate-binding protein [Betaproteobacteria bacterium]
MNRRDAVLALVALGSTPVTGMTQQGRISRIGILSVRSRSTPSIPDLYFDAFVQGMRELGNVEGKNLVIEWRFAEGKVERVPALAAELIRLNVEVIVTHSTVAAKALQRASRAIPVVCATCGDPVSTGITASLARPDGNVTGLSLMATEVNQKNLELLKIMMPALSRAAVLVNPDNPGNSAGLKGFQTAAQQLGVMLLPVEARTPEEIERGFAAMARERVNAVAVMADPLFIIHRRRITELVARYRLPSSFYSRDDVEAGGLMSYGQNLKEFYRSAATYVDKILKGAKPAELPIEQPTRIHLAINRRTAKALGITISQELLLRVDEVIE